MSDYEVEGQYPGFTSELRALINRHGIDASWNTPDFILAAHMIQSLTNFGVTLEETRQWHGWPTLAESLRSRTTHHITHDTEGGPHVG